MEAAYSRELTAFLDAGPTAYHVAENLKRELLEAGYTRLFESAPWTLCEGGKYFVVRGESSVIAFRIPCKAFYGFMIGAAHSDSPTFKVRETAEVASAGGCARLSVEPYGGMILRSWMDRPLSVAGRVMVRQGDHVVSRLVKVDRDLLVIPSVAPHMDREINKGSVLKANVDLLPLFSQGTETGAFRHVVAESMGVRAEDIVATDLFLYVRTPATVFGADGEFLSGPGLDDRECVFCCMQGFLQAAESESVPVLAVFNNEEVGSGTRQGADSTFLTDVLRRINGALERSDEEYLMAAANSFMVSADNAHAIHPAHPEYADSNEFPVLNGGVVIKYNAAQRYMTDAVSEAAFRQVCERAGVPVQRYSNRADMPGGSTLGNVSTAHLSIPGVDIGLPQLAMHAAYEVAGAKDAEYLVRAMKTFYASSFRCDGETISI